MAIPNNPTMSSDATRLRNPCQCAENECVTVTVPFQSGDDASATIQSHIADLQPGESEVEKIQNQLVSGIA
jgi:hypothetical protein